MRTFSTYKYNPYQNKYDLFLNGKYYQEEKERIDAFFKSYLEAGEDVWCDVNQGAQIYRSQGPNEEGTLFSFKNKEVAALFKLAFDASSVTS